MYPLQFEQLAKLHLEELQREAMATRCADSARVKSGKSASKRVSSRYWSHPVLWYLLMGHRMPIFTAKQEVTPAWMHNRWNATSRVIGLAALGVGLLAGSYFSTWLGLFPVVFLGALLCAVVSLPIVMRSLILLKQYLLRQAG